MGEEPVLMIAPLRTPLDDQLRDLWSRRTSLTRAEWCELYDIVTRALASYRPGELAGLRESNEVYVQDYFADKVFRLDLISRCDHVGALRVYYRNFLRDRLTAEKRSPPLQGEI